MTWLTRRKVGWIEQDEQSWTSPLRWGYAYSVIRADMVIFAGHRLREDFTTYTCRGGSDLILTCNIHFGRHIDMSQSKKPVSRKAKPEPVASKAAALVLDPAEVMRAMMAARKGKGKQVSSPEDSGDESDSDGPDSDEELSVSESEDGSPDEQLGETSEAGSSRSLTPARRINGNGNDAEEVDGELPDFRSALTTASAPTSRVQQATRIQPPPPPKPLNPLDAHEKPSVNATFTSLGLSQPLINALANINIKKPTEIQAACVGPILAGERHHPWHKLAC
jgi:ATP-dependent RNA helicase DDX49/DBP8